SEWWKSLASEPALRAWQMSHDIHLQLHEFNGQVREVTIPPLCPSVLNGHILALPPTEAAQLLQEERSLFPIRRSGRGTEHEHTNLGHRPHLRRLGGERYHGEAEGEEDNESDEPHRHDGLPATGCLE